MQVHHTYHFFLFVCFFFDFQQSVQDIIFVPGGRDRGAEGETFYVPKSAQTRFLRGGGGKIEKSAQWRKNFDVLWANFFVNEEDGGHDVQGWGTLEGYLQLAHFFCHLTLFLAFSNRDA